MSFSPPNLKLDQPCNVEKRDLASALKRVCRDVFHRTVVPFVGTETSVFLLESGKTITRQWDWQARRD